MYLSGDSKAAHHLVTPWLYSIHFHPIKHIIHEQLRRFRGKSLTPNLRIKDNPTKLVGIKRARSGIYVANNRI